MKEPAPVSLTLYKHVWVRWREGRSHGLSEWTWEWIRVPDQANWRKAVRARMESMGQGMHAGERGFTLYWNVVKNPPLEVVEKKRDSAVREIMYAEAHAKAMAAEFARVNRELKKKRSA